MRRRPTTIEGLDEVFDSLVQTYDSASDLGTVVVRMMRESPADREKRLTLARQIMRDHSFDARARSIVAVTLELDRLRMIR